MTYRHCDLHENDYPAHQGCYLCLLDDLSDLRVKVETLRNVLQQIADDETDYPRHLAKLTLEENP